LEIIEIIHSRRNIKSFKSDEVDKDGVFGIGYPEEINKPKERTPIEEKLKYLS